MFDVDSACPADLESFTTNVPDPRVSCGDGTPEVIMARKGPLALPENYSKCSVNLVCSADTLELNTFVSICVA